jgi:hypothetical protein
LGECHRRGQFAIILILPRQLSPGSCYTADLRFLPLSAGVLSIESIRVIDLNTNEAVDIRDLPSIVAVE